MTRYDAFSETRGGRLKYAAYVCLVAVNALWERLPERVGQNLRIQRLDSGAQIIVADRTLAHRAYFALFLPALKWAAPHLWKTTEAG